MAEAPEKPAPEIGTWLIGVIVVISIFGMIVTSVRDRFGIDISTPDSAIETGREGFRSLLSDPDSALGTFVRGWQVAAWILSILSIAGIVFCLWKIRQIREEEAKKFRVPGVEAFRMSAAERIGEDSRWRHIETLMQSENPSDWRQAIIEADIMLDELVTRMGYDGETLGEKMKQIEKSDFTTLDDAWEAHKVRNRIAHDGSDFILTLREARRVIELYHQVFEEFHLV